MKKLLASVAGVAGFSVAAKAMDNASASEKQAGDIVYEVDAHWVANGGEVAAFRKKQKQFLDKKIDVKTYNQLRNDIRKKTERALMPIKIREKLTVGTAGAINVTWVRGDRKITTKMNKAVTQAPAFSVANGTITLPLHQGTVESLKKVVTQRKDWTLDLRHNVNGDFNVMRQVLALLARSGNYGVIATDRKEASTPLEISKGTANPPKLTLLVDRTTAGAAEILALALSNKAGAKVSGSQMSGDRMVVQVISLPDNSGYTLVTGTYSSQPPVSKIAKGAGK